MSKKITEEFDGLLKQSYYPLFKNLSVSNPEVFTHNVLSTDDKNLNFFLTFSRKHHNISSVHLIDFYNLCSQFGYDIKQESLYSKTLSNLSYGFSSNYNNADIKLTDYILLYSIIPDDNLISYITEKLGKDYILKQNKLGCDLLLLAYNQNLPKTISKLIEFGLSQNNNPSEYKILTFAEKKPELLNLYWKIENNSKNNHTNNISNDEFEHLNNFVSNKIYNITKHNLSELEKIQSIIDKKNDNLSVEQKEILFITSLSSKEIKVVKYFSKILNEKMSSDYIQQLVIPHIKKIKHEQIFFSIFKSPIAKLIHLKTNEFAIYGLIDFCVANNIIPYIKGYEKKTERLNNLFSTFIYPQISNELLFEKYNNKNWFTIFSEKQKGFLILKPQMNIIPINRITQKNFETQELNLEFLENNSISQEKITQIQQILETTWFYKDENNISNFEKNIIYSIGDIGQIWLFNPQHLKFNYFTTSQKELMLNHFLNMQMVTSNGLNYPIEKWNSQINENISNTVFFKALYLNMVNDSNVNWKNIIIHNQNVLKDLTNTEFIFELNARQLNSKLNAKLDAKLDEKSIFVKPIKI